MCCVIHTVSVSTLLWTVKARIMTSYRDTLKISTVNKVNRFFTTILSLWPRSLFLPPAFRWRPVHIYFIKLTYKLPDYESQRTVNVSYEPVIINMVLTLHHFSFINLFPLLQTTVLVFFTQMQTSQIIANDLLHIHEKNNYIQGAAK